MLLTVNQYLPTNISNFISYLLIFNIVPIGLTVKPLSFKNPDIVVFIPGAGTIIFGELDRNWYIFPGVESGNELPSTNPNLLNNSIASLNITFFLYLY